MAERRPGTAVAAVVTLTDPEVDVIQEEAPKDLV